MLRRLRAPGRASAQSCMLRRTLTTAVLPQHALQCWAMINDGRCNPMFKPRHLLSLITLAGLAACGGGGGSTATSTSGSGTGSGTSSSPVTSSSPASTTAGTDVVTYKNDALRTGSNTTETVLTTANVSSSTFGLLRNLSVDGKVDSQPLYLSQL